MSPAVTAALIAALVAACGWFVSNLFARDRDTRLRRYELRLKHLERQISEFYGPLHSLVEQLMVTNDVQERVLSRQHKMNLPPEDAARLRRLLHADYFRPLHEQIVSILRSRLYLVEGVALPETFYQYLRHSNQERVQVDLWQKEHIDTSHVGIPWPSDFPNEIRTSLDGLMQEYEQLMRGITLPEADTRLRLREFWSRRGLSA